MFFCSLTSLSLQNGIVFEFRCWIPVFLSVYIKYLSRLHTLRVKPTWFPSFSIFFFFWPSVQYSTLQYGSCIFSELGYFPYRQNAVLANKNILIWRVGGGSALKILSTGFASLVLKVYRVQPTILTYEMVALLHLLKMKFFEIIIRIFLLPSSILSFILCVLSFLPFLLSWFLPQQT